MYACSALLVFTKGNANLNAQLVSFMPILSELNRCFDYGQKMCMLFGHNPGYDPLIILV